MSNKKVFLCIDLDSNTNIITIYRAGFFSVQNGLEVC